MGTPNAAHDDGACIGASLSPGLRAMVARVGAAAPFAKASELLATLAGVALTTKRVERSAEPGGQGVLAISDTETAAVLTGHLVPLGPSTPVAKLYVAMDGTGVPTVPADTAGRAGKYPDGRARTREVKLGVLSTQTGVDQDGHPVRDPSSSSYLATLQPAPHFGSLVYTEARRRGSAHAQQVVVLGDAHPAWLAARLADLDAGDITALLTAARALQLPDAQREQVDKALGYFQTNAQRMTYAYFREHGHFVGSGAVEAGRKAVVGQRLKQSRMRWTVRAAAGIVTLRCQEASGRWEEIWHRPDNHTRAG